MTFSVVSRLVDTLLQVSGWPVYVVVGTLTLLETAALVGLVLPGETAMVIAGVLAARGNVSLPVLLTVAVGAAILGDQIGYTTGRHFGARLRAGRVGRRVPAHRWTQAQESISRHGVWAVVSARFVGVLRAVVPTAAGIVGMPRRRFILANLLGGSSWASLAVLVGYWAGGSVSNAQDLLSRLSWVGAGTLALLVCAVLVRRRRGRSRPDVDAAPFLHPGDAATASGPATASRSISRSLTRSRLRPPAASLAALVLGCACLTTGSGPAQASRGSRPIRDPGGSRTVGSPSSGPTQASSPTASSTRVTKVLVVVIENHSLRQMRAQMPYASSLTDRYAYASNYQGLAHPSLPNYLAIAGGSTYGVSDDDPPAAHPIAAASVFGAAALSGSTAKVYAEDMTASCQQTNHGQYAVRHNPWAYFSASSERQQCGSADVGTASLTSDLRQGLLPTVGMVAPNVCHDAHNCSLKVADSWFRSLMAAVLAGPDYQQGRLAVVLTTDEDDGSQANTVLTVVVHRALDGAHRVVNQPLNHYALSRFLQDVAHVTPYLGQAGGAPDLATAFGLTAG